MSKQGAGPMKRRFRSVEEIERVLFPRLYAERRKSERLHSELDECGEALTACEEAHGVRLGTDHDPCPGVTHR
jgi:hypothetical protein